MGKTYTVKSSCKKTENITEAILAAKGNTLEAPEQALCLHVAGKIEKRDDDEEN